MSRLDINDRVYGVTENDEHIHDEPAPCMWLAHCPNEANGLRDAGPVGMVAICQSCDDNLPALRRQEEPEMSEKVTVKVLLGACRPYEPGDMLCESLLLTTGFPACGDVGMLLRLVREQFYVDEPRADIRSLSVGDVVIVGEQGFAVEPVCGWKPVHVEAYQIWHDGELMRLIPED